MLVQPGVVPEEHAGERHTAHDAAVRHDPGRTRNEGLVPVPGAQPLARHRQQQRAGRRARVEPQQMLADAAERLVVAQRVEGERQVLVGPGLSRREP